MNRSAEMDKNPTRRGVGRREFLWTLAASGLATCYVRGQASGLGTGLASLGVDGFTESAEPAATASPITSNADFFIRNHFKTPTINEEKWNLEIAGLVSKPLKLSYSDLLLGSSVRTPITLECAGNLSGGSGVSSAVWSGVLLGELLKQAGLRPGAATVVFHGADSGEGEDVPPGTHFARAIPVDKAMDPSTLLVYEMNGAPLPAEHGFPLRALVGGWYGMDSVKWLTRVEVSQEPFTGYFQRERYVALKSDGQREAITVMRVNSKFLRPSNDEEIRSKAYRVEGLAWAGERKVSKVEVRFDNAGTWQPATLTAPPVAMQWTPWSYEWHIPRPGQYTLEVRAVDDAGRIQPEVRDQDRKDAYELNTSQRVKVTVRL
jgi:DMSO/TMAO reductase YedYZ molybdopterin-dependent catalytic subunit